MKKTRRADLFNLVGVLRTYCNSQLATRQLNDLLVAAQKSTRQPREQQQRPAKANPKLAKEAVAELVLAYRSGASVNQLATTFGIHRSTVKDHLRRAGVEIRPGQPPKLTEIMKDEVVELYKSGLSIRKIAVRFGVTDNPVHHALKERGAQMRVPSGRL